MFFLLIAFNVSGFIDCSAIVTPVLSSSASAIILYISITLSACPFDQATENLIGNPVSCFNFAMCSVKSLCSGNKPKLESAQSINSISLFAAQSNSAHIFSIECLSILVYKVSPISQNVHAYGQPLDGSIVILNFFI